jgi:hypothetical protein
LIKFLKGSADFLVFFLLIVPVLCFVSSLGRSTGMFNPKKPRGRQTLTSGLDNKILNYVREHTQLALDSAEVPGIPQLYRLLQERDGQLRRMKKLQLEASIQRALNIIQQEIVLDSDDDSFDSELEGIEDLNLVEVKVRIGRNVLTLGSEYS